MICVEVPNLGITEILNYMVWTYYRMTDKRMVMEAKPSEEKHRKRIEENIIKYLKKRKV